MNILQAFSSASNHWVGQDQHSRVCERLQKMAALLGTTKPIATLTTSDIRQLSSRLVATRSPATVNHYLGNLRTALGVLAEDGVIHEAPKVPQVRATQQHMRRALSDEERERLLAMMTDESNKALTIFLLETGLRINEALGLQWEHISMDPNTGRGQVHVLASKTGAERTVPLTEDARKSLLPRLSEAMPFDINYRGYYRAFVNAAKRAALGKGVTPHCLRHTCATRLLTKGKASLAHVQAWLGHRDLKSTMVYAHVAHVDDLAEVAEKMQTKGELC